jgi:hypothetical protein
MVQQVGGLLCMQQLHQTALALSSMLCLQVVSLPSERQHKQQQQL